MVCDGGRDDKDTLGGVKKTGSNPTDCGNGGVKRSVLTEANDIPVALAIDDVNRRNMKLVKPMLDDLKLDRPTSSTARPQGLCMDKGYDYEDVRTRVAQFAFTAHIRARGEEVQKGLVEDVRAAEWREREFAGWAGVDLGGCSHADCLAVVM